MVGAAVLFVGARQILAGTLTIGGLFTYTILLGFLVAPIFQVVSIGTQLTEALAGLERTHEILRERPEDVDPRRTRRPRAASGARSPSRTCASRTTAGATSCAASPSAPSRAR